MSQIDDTITTYLAALAVEGKRPRTIESYDESLGTSPHVLPRRECGTRSSTQ